MLCPMMMALEGELLAGINQNTLRWAMHGLAGCMSARGFVGHVRELYPQHRGLAFWLLL